MHSTLLHSIRVAALTPAFRIHECWSDADVAHDARDISCVWDQIIGSREHCCVLLIVIADPAM
jgi:hypothetical protein